MARAPARAVEYVGDEGRDPDILGARKALGQDGKPLEQKRLAELLDVHPSLLNRYERKRETTPADVSLVCRVIIAAQRAGRLDIINEALGDVPPGFSADSIIRSSDGSTWTVAKENGQPVRPFEQLRRVLGFVVELAGRVEPRPGVELETRATIIRGASDGIAWCFRVAGERLTALSR